MNTQLRIVSLCLWVGVGFGCEASDDADVPQETPLILEDAPVGELIAIEPGGETVCSRGTPFRFLVRGGTTNKVVIDFAGGGACWSETTCGIAGAIFNEEAPTLESLEGLGERAGFGGLFDFDNPEHPFPDHHIVHIPYCTGDVHWGNATHEYNDDLTIEHKGYVNASTALQWVYDRFDAPDEIIVTGCSAGAYGAIIHSAFIAKHYPDTRLRVMADAGVGIITDAFFEESFPKWNAQANVPDFVPGLEDISDKTITDLWSSIAAYFPQHRFAQHTTAFDDNQIFYFEAMGGDKSQWSPRMFDVMDTIAKAASNFRYYVAPGPVHCILPYDIMYSRVSDGVGFLDWLEDFVSGDELPANVECSQCLRDSMCGRCEAGEDLMYCGFCSGWVNE